MISEKIDDCLFWVLALTLLVLPVTVTTLTADVFGAPKIAILRLAAIALAAAALFYLLTTNKARLPRGPAAIAAVIFILLMGIATALSIDKTISVIGLRKRFFGFSTYLILVIIFASAAAPTWTYERLRRLSWLAVAGAAGAVLIAAAQQMGAAWPADLTAVFGNSAYSTFGNPNFLGAYLAMSLGPALALVRSAPGRGAQATAAATAAALLIGVALARSSGAAAAAVIVAATFFFLTESGPSTIRGRRLAAAAALFICIFGAVWLRQSDSTALRSRLIIWQASARLIGAGPWHGAGPDAVRFAIPAKLPATKNLVNEIPEDGHNLLLTVAATAGLPALAAFLALAYFGMSGMTGAARAAGGRSAVLLCGLVAAMAGYLAANFVNPENLASAAFFWLCLGIAQSRRWGRLDYRAPPAVIYPVLLLLLVGILAASVYTGRSFRAEVHLARAEAARQTEPMLFEYSQAERSNPYYDWYSIRIADRLMPLVGPDRPVETKLAIAAADRAIEKAPLESDNYVIKGSVYRNLAKAGGAKSNIFIAAALYRQALGLNRLNLHALRDLIDCHLMLGDERRARYYINRYLSLVDDPKIEAIRRNIR